MKHIRTVTLECRLLRIFKLGIHKTRASGLSIEGFGIGRRIRYNQRSDESADKYISSGDG